MHTILSFPAAEIGRACEDKAFLDPDDLQGPEDGGGERGSGRGRQELSVQQVLLREEFVSDEPDVRRKEMDDEPERVGDPWNRFDGRDEDVRVEQDRRGRRGLHGRPRLSARRRRVFRSRDRFLLRFDLRDERGQVDPLEFLVDPASELLRVQPLKPQTPVLSFDQEKLRPRGDALRISRLLRDHDSTGAVHRDDRRHEWFVYHHNDIMVSIPSCPFQGEPREHRPSSPRDLSRSRIRRWASLGTLGATDGRLRQTRSQGDKREDIRKIYVISHIYCVRTVSPRGRPNNRVFTDMDKLRQAVNDLVGQGRHRIIHHAREAHPEFSDLDRVEVVRWGGRDKPDRKRDPSDGVYLCWLKHPRHGLCRGVYAIEQTPGGEILYIISVMPEEG